MTKQDKGRPTRQTAGVRSMSIQRALVWAFRNECARLAPPGSIEPSDTRPGVSTVWVMIQRGNLGCKVEGGGISHPHEDAEAIAGVVSGLPDALGGFRMATTIAELARADLEPDWLEGQRARCVPLIQRRNRFGTYAKPEVLHSITYKHAGRTYTRKVEWCRVTYTPSPSQIESGRRRYGEWRQALDEIRQALQSMAVLRRIVITDELPPAEPWAIYRT